jgi:hypothetical protein
MKLNILVTFILFHFITPTLFAQSAAVIVPRKNNLCGKRTDLGYSIITDTKPNTQNEIKKTLEAYPDIKAIELIGFDKNEGGQSVLVIISATTKDNDCDTRVTYGVGFGKNPKNALKKAISWLSMLNSDWSEIKDDYQVVFEKDFSKKEEGISSTSTKTLLNEF